MNIIEKCAVKVYIPALMGRRTLERSVARYIFVCRLARVQVLTNTSLRHRSNFLGSADRNSAGASPRGAQPGYTCQYPPRAG